MTLYLVAAHRMVVDSKPSATPYTTPLFAGRVPAAQLGVTPLEGDSVYLTAFTEALSPGQITADYTFRQAPDDKGFQRVVYEDVDMTWLTALVGLGALTAGALAIALMLVRSGRRRATRRPTGGLPG